MTQLSPRSSERSAVVTLVALIATLWLAAGCATNVPNANGQAAIDLDPGTKGPVSGVGIESQDVIAMGAGQGLLGSATRISEAPR